MTPTATIARTPPSASFELIPRKGFDVAFARSNGSGNGTVDPADAAWPREMRRTVRAGLDRWPPHLVAAAELLVSELVTNAFRHGRGDVRVRMLFDDGRMQLEVRDGSHEFPIPRTATDLDEGGRGLAIVQAVADDWGVKNNGTTTWCSLVLPPLDGTP
ncbi:ATP-binding protein [Streptomyces sp. NPDC048484]|uniref:ATP-binding protein n=1 Tax=Streptomyces sp. NPDC048484 TaxID=3155146 RepID=UPI0034378380